MTRLTLTLAAWVIFVPVSFASLAPQQDRPADERTLLRTRAAKPWAASVQPIPVQEQRNDYIVTERTAVLLDGKPCRFQDVPAQAVIVGMEVAADKKTVLKVRFRSGK
jgi:hypothetical protein